MPGFLASVNVNRRSTTLVLNAVPDVVAPNVVASDVDVPDVGAPRLTCEDCGIKLGQDGAVFSKQVQARSHPAGLRPTAGRHERGGGRAS